MKIYDHFDGIMSILLNIIIIEIDFTYTSFYQNLFISVILFDLYVLIIQLIKDNELKKNNINVNTH